MDFNDEDLFRRGIDSRKFARVEVVEAKVRRKARKAADIMTVPFPPSPRTPSRR